MKISEQLAQMEQTLTELSAQLAELEAQTSRLEEENEWLRARITTALDKNKTTGGRMALRELYEEGYHICPAYFGKKHDGGCLFCMEVLQNVSN